MPRFKDLSDDEMSILIAHYAEQLTGMKKAFENILVNAKIPHTKDENGEVVIDPELLKEWKGFQKNDGGDE